MKVSYARAALLLNGAVAGAQCTFMLCANTIGWKSNRCSYEWNRSTVSIDSQV